MCTSDLEFLGIWNHNIELSINAKCWNLVMRFMSDQMAQRLQVLSYFSPWKISLQTQFWLVHLGLAQTHMAAIWVLRLLDVNGIQWLGELVGKIWLNSETCPELKNFIFYAFVCQNSAVSCDFSLPVCNLLFLFHIFLWAKIWQGSHIQPRAVEGWMRFV